MTAITDSPAIRIEPATADDLGAIVKIGRETFTASFAWSMPLDDLRAYLDTSYTLAAFRREFEDTRTNTFHVARTPDAHVAGFIQVKRNTTEPCLPPGLSLVEVHRVYVATSQHGRGIGNAMLKTVLDAARATEEYDGAWIGVWEENLRAQKLYGKFGFTEKVGRHDFKMGSCVQYDDILVARF